MWRLLSTTLDSTLTQSKVTTGMPGKRTAVTLATPALRSRRHEDSCKLRPAWAMGEGTKKMTSPPACMVAGIRVTPTGSCRNTWSPAGRNDRRDQNVCPEVSFKVSTASTILDYSQSALCPLSMSHAVRISCYSSASLTAAMLPPWLTERDVYLICLSRELWAPIKHFFLEATSVVVLAHNRKGTKCSASPVLPRTAAWPPYQLLEVFMHV